MEHPSDDLIPLPMEALKAITLTHAFDRWRKLDRQLETVGPGAVSPEMVAHAWADVIDAYNEWSLSR